MLDKNTLLQIPIMSELSDNDITLISGTAQRVSLPTGAPVFSIGQECGAFIFLINGSVRVHMTAENGREIVLYRVEDGQTCILTTACLLGNDAYCAEAVCEEPSEAIILPAASFHQLIGSSDAFRHKIFNNYAQRLSGLMGLIEEIAFAKMDHRLAHFLIEQSHTSPILKKTHYDLSVELGSAREVISRLLKDFEKKKWIALRRGEVEVLDKNALENLIQS